jgi:ubiquinone/menaquinone biosynthesis C-methylase UbiE/DNA-binding transcriptional ArsR family regulator
MSAVLPLLDSLSALADPTRCRMLRLLDRQELTVGELGAVLQLPQSTVSRHLKTLADAEWVTSRRDGTSRYYAIALGEPEAPRRQIWDVTREELRRRPGLDQDERRLAAVLKRRSETSQQFFATSAGQWDRLRDDLFGRDFWLHALPGLLPAEWTVGDLGCGTGVLAAALGPHVAKVIGVDGSDEMLDAARARVAGLPNVDLRRGPLESLPIDDASLDAVTLVLVLHHVPAPAAALDEAARVLRPGGRLLVVDMAPHDREEYRREMGHVWLGFSDDQMRRLLDDSGFTSIRLQPLPAAADAGGPALFVASAVAPAAAPSLSGSLSR